MPRRRRSRTRIEPKVKTGSVTGSTTPESGVQWGEPLDNVVESVSSDTIVTDTVLETKSSSVPTSSVSSTTSSSPIRMADKLVVASYQPGEPLLLLPVHLPKLLVLANGLGVPVENVVERIWTIVVQNGSGNWFDRTMADVIDYYLANFYYE